MIDVNEYILFSLKQRQAHLRLKEKCVERGGVSYQMKVLLAYVLDTTVPQGHKIHVCHACHNGKCNNPFHTYWGTPQENRADATAFGVNDKSIWILMVNKYGKRKASDLARMASYKRQELAKERAVILRKERLDSGDGRRISENNSQFGTMWIKRNNKERKIDKKQFRLFKTHGWEPGRLPFLAKLLIP